MIEGGSLCAGLECLDRLEPGGVEQAAVAPARDHHHAMPAVERPSGASQPAQTAQGFLYTTHYRPIAAPHDGPSTNSDDKTELEGLVGGRNSSDTVPLFDARRSTPPPPGPPTPKRIVLTHLEPAMLIRRVEPVYPPLAIQVHREGQVELHAIVGSDGTIRSLEVLRGDVMFLHSALDAVTAWRYRPTYLNGLPVEVETIITVTYRLAH